MPSQSLQVSTSTTHKQANQSHRKTWQASKAPKLSQQVRHQVKAPNTTTFTKRPKMGNIHKQEIKTTCSRNLKSSVVTKTPIYMKA